MDTSNNDTASKPILSHKGRTIGRPAFPADDVRRGETLTNLVHELSHEIGNPLTSIISFATVIGREAADGTPSKKTSFYAESIVDEAWRVAHANEKITLLFSDRGVSPGSCGLEPALTYVLSRLKREFPDQVNSLLIRREGRVSSVFIEQGQLRSLWRELLENAFEALAANDTASDSAQGRRAEIRFSDDSQMGEFVLTNYSKLPCPVPLEKLFEPGVCAGNQNKHLGLGLTVSWVIVSRFGGEIQLEEETIADGVLFHVRVRLPKHQSKSLGSGSYDAPRPETSRLKQLKQILPKRFRVLIIEDEPTVSSAIDKLLEILIGPHTELTCRVVSDRQAISFFDEGDRFDLVLCDLTLRGTTGQYLYEIVQKQFPEEQRSFAFLTGDQRSKETREYLAGCNRPFLHKPFEAEDLLKLIIEVLERNK